MTKILHCSDNEKWGQGATIRFDNGEPCVLNIAKTGIVVKRSRFFFFGTTLYNQTNSYRNNECALALAHLFPEPRFPDIISDPVMRTFLNAILHCNSAAEVFQMLNQAVTAVETKLGHKINEITDADLPIWARQLPH